MSETKSLTKSPHALENLDGSPFSFLIVCARWNKEINEALVNGVYETLVNDYNVDPQRVSLVTVPGSYELPFACQRYMRNSSFHACIAIGTLIKGATMHFEYISEAVSRQLMQLQMRLERPVIFGVLTCLTEDQARERAGLLKPAAGASHATHNHGVDWAAAAVEMAILNSTSGNYSGGLRYPPANGPKLIENFKVLEGPEEKRRIKF